MTDPARAAVEAMEKWMGEPCPHIGRWEYTKQKCARCLLAFAAAQRDLQTEEAYEEGRRVGRAEGRKEGAIIIVGHCDDCRARREEPFT